MILPDNNTCSHRKQDGIAEVHWLAVWDFATSTIFSWYLTTDYHFFKHLDTFIIFTNSATRAGYDIRSIFQQSLTDFSFS